jgi:hypothetical protein
MTPGGCSFLAIVLTLLALLIVPVGVQQVVTPPVAPPPAAIGSSEPFSLHEAEALWQTSGPGSYRIEVRAGSAWELNTYTVTVRNGEIADAEVRCDPGMTGMTNCPEDAAAAAADFTVPGLFAQAQRTIDYGNGRWLAVQFDAATGYPLSMYFDDPDILDEQWFVTVLSFEVLPE